MQDVATKKLELSADTTETSTSELSELAKIAEEFKPEAPEIQGVEVDSATLLANLEEKRAKGKFPIHHYTSAKLARLANFMKTKAKFSGIQEAYFLVSLNLQLANLLMADGHLKQHERNQDRVYELPAPIIEILVYFLNKHEGSSLSSASGFIEIAQPINNALANIQAADKKIQELRVELGIEKPKDLTAQV
jgi:prepilin-type processing-associated H-X9-DG protein